MFGSNVYKLEEENDLKIEYIPVEKIKPNPYQPRRFFDKASMDELTNSIREFGIMQPINVRRINQNSYELIAGERRLRASRLANLPLIPAIVVELSDRDSAMLALIENLQREDLNFLEEAEGYQNLMADYSMTQDELAKKIGKSQSSVANKLRVLKLSPSIKKLLIEHHLTERHARALLRIPDERIQISILCKVIEQELTVKKTEELVESTIDKILNVNSEKDGVKQQRKIKRYIKDIRLFTNTIKQAVDMMHQAGVDAKYEVEEKDSFLEIKINIPCF